MVNRMRLFARFHSVEEHEQLIQSLLKAKRLRKEISRLQMYRRMGFTSLVEAERFEMDRNRREAHHMACEQKEKEEKIVMENSKSKAATATQAETKKNIIPSLQVNSSYLKEYKQNDRNKYIYI